MIIVVIPTAPIMCKVEPAMGRRRSLPARPGPLVRMDIRELIWWDSMRGPHRIRFMIPLDIIRIMAIVTHRSPPIRACRIRYMHMLLSVPALRSMKMDSSGHSRVNSWRDRLVTNWWSHIILKIVCICINMMISPTGEAI